MSEVDLASVQIFTRHGYRTPLSGSPFYSHSGTWSCSSVQHLMFTRLHTDQSSPEGEVQPLKVDKKYIPGAQVLPGNCYLGQLTPQGFLQMRELGRQLRKRYVADKSSSGLTNTQILSDVLSSSELYVRSTDTPRTFDTAQAILDGLYPKEKRSKENESIEIHTVEAKSEFLYPRSSCELLNKLWKDLRQTQAFRAHSQELALFWNGLQTAQSTKLTSEKPPSSWGSLHNKVEALYHHQLKIPYGLNKEMLEGVLAEQSGKEIDIIWNHSKYVSGEESLSRIDPNLPVRLGAGLIVKEIAQNIQNKVEDKENKKPKFLLYSVHDSSLSVLLSAFRIFDVRHPPMGSHFAVELYKSKSSPSASSGNSDNYFVRMVYDGVELTMPGCSELKKVFVADSNNRIETCPLSVFQSLSRPLIPHDIHQECSAGSTVRSARSAYL
eukprot:TRINITY_DN8790_c0_g1_i1.p1 TRINITY_DN8790_c0_g1~~TRINITY_DN8790_c0_g1_i1.p1  ORF type:complete len:452 (-),score=80.17 TRINITY_DN8790_c0_g1_i1:178-1491(-)